MQVANFLQAKKVSSKKIRVLISHNYLQASEIINGAFIITWYTPRTTY